MLKGTSNEAATEYRSYSTVRCPTERSIESAFNRRLDPSRLGGDLFGPREDSGGIERFKFGDARFETADSPTHLLGREPGVSGSGRSGTGSHAKRTR
jgi:hypothetical protein